jgi:hypothetical protein
LSANGSKAADSLWAFLLKITPRIWILEEPFFMSLLLPDLLAASTSYFLLFYRQNKGKVSLQSMKAEIEAEIEAE